MPNSRIAAGKGFHAIGDDCFRLAVALQCLLQKRQGLRFVAFPDKLALEDLAFVIDSRPQVVTLPIDIYEHFAEVPLPTPEALKSAAPLPPDVGSEHWSAPVPPQAHRLVAYVDFALEQQVSEVWAGSPTTLAGSLFNQVHWL